MTYGELDCRADRLARRLAAAVRRAIANASHSDSKPFTPARTVYSVI